MSNATLSLVEPTATSVALSISGVLPVSGPTYDTCVVVVGPLSDGDSVRLYGAFVGDVCGCIRKDEQVRLCIVCLVPVCMVNNFLGQQWAPEHLRCNDAMLQKRPGFRPDQDVSVLIDASTTAPEGVITAASGCTGAVAITESTAAFIDVSDVDGKRGSAFLTCASNHSFTHEGMLHHFLYSDLLQKVGRP